MRKGEMVSPSRPRMGQSGGVEIVGQNNESSVARVPNKRQIMPPRTVSQDGGSSSCREAGRLIGETPVPRRFSSVRRQPDESQGYGRAPHRYGVTGQAVGGTHLDALEWSWIRRGRHTLPR